MVLRYLGRIGIYSVGRVIWFPAGCHTSGPKSRLSTRHGPWAAMTRMGSVRQYFRPLVSEGRVILLDVLGIAGRLASTTRVPTSVQDVINSSPRLLGGRILRGVPGIVIGGELLGGQIITRHRSQ
jgi:hypothetical protein